jgi:ribosomal protein S14
MLSLKLKNNKLRHSFYKIEKTKIIGKFLEGYISTFQKKLNLLHKLKGIKVLRKKFYIKTSRVQIKTRCIFTNRSKSVFKKTGASRFVLRNLIQFGFLPGYKKAVW